MVRQIACEVSFQTKKFMIDFVASVHKQLLKASASVLPLTGLFSMFNEFGRFILSFSFPMGLLQHFPNLFDVVLFSSSMV